MALISKTAAQATAAVAELARLNHGTYVSAGDIADAIGAPPNYLSKLLKTLAETGVLESQKGSGGGFRLARPATAISLREVVEPIEHVGRRLGCFLGQAECSDENACPAHQRWKKVCDAYVKFLEQTTVADVTKSHRS